MRYSIKTKDRIYVKGYRFLSFAKNMNKNLSNKYSQKRLDNAKKARAGAMKTSSKIVIQKTAEATGDLIGIKIAGKINLSKKYSRELHLQNNKANDKIEIPKERYIYISRKRQQIIDDLRLV